MSYDGAKKNKNKTLREILYELFKDNQTAYPHLSEDLKLAEQINLIRSNLSKIVQSQEDNSFKAFTQSLSYAKKNEKESGKNVFLKKLYSFMEAQGQPILKPPKLGFQDLDLYKLYCSVVKRGGMDQVTRKQEWKEVYMELGIPTMSTSASYNTRTNYKKYLYLYELENEPQIHGYDEENQADDSEKPSSSDSDHPDAGSHFSFKPGQYIKIESKLHDGQIYYAKILRRQVREGIPSYYVMYNGWTISHNEWMPEYALQQLSFEEQLCPEKLTNPPAIRSSKSNYLIEEHLGISSLSSPTPASPSSLKSGVSSEQTASHNKRSSTPLGRQQSSTGIRRSLFPNDGVTKGDINVANILASIGSDMKHQIPRSGSSSEEDQQMQNYARQQSNLHSKSVTGHATAHLWPITPPSLQKVEYTPAEHLNTPQSETSLQTSSSPTSMYDSSLLPFDQTAHQQGDMSLLSNDNIRHHQQHYNLKPDGYAKIRAGMSSVATQAPSELSRKRRQVGTQKSQPVAQSNLFDLEKFSEEAKLLHSLPPSNGLANPPPISKLNLSQLATLSLLSFSQPNNCSEEEITSNGNHSASKDDNNPSHSLLPSKRIKIPEYRISESKAAMPEVKITSISLQSLSEVKEKLDYLRQRVLDANLKLKQRSAVSEGSETGFSAPVQNPGRKKNHRKISYTHSISTVHAKELAD